MFSEHNGWPNAMTYNLYSTLTSIDTSCEYLYAQLEQHALSEEQFQHTVTNWLHEWADGRAPRRYAEVISLLAQQIIYDGVRYAELWAVLDALKAKQSPETTNPFTLCLIQALTPTDWQTIIKPTKPQPTEWTSVEDFGDWVLDDEDSRLRQWIESSLLTWHEQRTARRMTGMPAMQTLGTQLIDAWIGVVDWNYVYNSLKEDL